MAALVALGLIIGLIGKLPRKLWRTLFTIGTVVAVFIFTPKAVEMVLGLNMSQIPVIGAGKEGTVNEFLLSKVAEALGDLYEIESIKGIINALPPILLWIVIFMVGGLLGIIIVPLILGIFVRIFTRKAKKGTAILSLGIFGAIRGACFALLICSPIIFLSPVLKNANAIYGLTTDEPKENVTKIVEMVEADVKKSYVVKYADEFLADPANPIGKFMVYSIEKEGQEAKTSYMYNDLGSIVGLVASYDQIKSIDFSNIEEMKPEDVKELFATLGDNLNSEAVKDVVSDVLADSLGVDIDLTNVDLAAEGETIAMAIEFMDPEKEITVEDITNLTEQLAGSDLVKQLAESETGEGMLSSIDQETQDSMKAQLESMKNDPDPEKQLSQEDYETLMKLFGTPAPTGGDE